MKTFVKPGEGALLVLLLSYSVRFIVKIQKEADADKNDYYFVREETRSFLNDFNSRCRTIENCLTRTLSNKSPFFVFA